MAVIVRTARHKSGRQIMNTHESASGVSVVEGHLHVRTWNGVWDTVAVYAPGQWVDAATEPSKVDSE